MTDKTALITGAGRGIGKDMARRFAAAGARVLLADIDLACAEQAANEIGLETVKPVGADVSNAEAVAKLFEAADEFFGRPLDILINNAGIAHHRAFLELSLSDWERVLRNNLTSVFLCGQAAAGRMAPTGHGRIINLGSISGQRGSSGRSAYGTAKAGIHQLTRVMAVELGPMGITVNVIAPGPIDTGITKFGPDQERRYLERLPVGRFGAAGDVAALAVFLASDEAAFINGAVYNVDGGFDAAGLIFSYEELTTVKSDLRDETEGD